MHEQITTRLHKLGITHIDFDLERLYRVASKVVSI